MMISDKQIQNVARLYGVQPAAEKTRESTKKERAQRQDEVSISSEAREMQLALRKIAETPDIRLERVEELKKKLADGTYRVPAEKVAEKMLGRVLTDRLIEK